MPETTPAGRSEGEEDDVAGTALEVDVADEEGRQFRISIKRLREKLGPEEIGLAREGRGIARHSPDNMT